jgi:hypothetical protein
MLLYSLITHFTSLYFQIIIIIIITVNGAIPGNRNVIQKEAENILK